MKNKKYKFDSVDVCYLVLALATLIFIITVYRS